MKTEHIPVPGQLNCVDVTLSRHQPAASEKMLRTFPGAQVPAALLRSAEAFSPVLCVHICQNKNCQAEQIFFEMMFMTNLPFLKFMKSYYTNVQDLA